MFEPKYTITDRLLANIKKINNLIFELNNKRFSKPVLVKLEKEARIISTFSSTSIEGNPLPLTEVKKILKSHPKNIRDTEREVLNYNKALIDLDKIFEKGSRIDFSEKFILSIHKQISNGLLGESREGKWRKEPVVIYKPTTQDIIYMSPDWQIVPKLVRELIEFIKNKKKGIDPLILAGIFHKQFVIIHPFMDGNGRTSRIITKFLLAEMGLNTFNLFSFENYYNQNVTKYVQKVGEYGDYNELIEKGEIDFTDWLEYFSEGIINELLRIKKILPNSATNPKEKVSSHYELILEYLQTHKFITDQDYSKITKRAKATRTIDFNIMIKLGLIERKGKGKNTYYVLSDLE